MAASATASADKATSSTPTFSALASGARASSRRAVIQTQGPGWQGVGWQAPNHHVSVGDGRRAATTSVARRPRRRACAVGTHSQRPGLVHPQDGTAARTDGPDVHRRQMNWHAAHHRRARERHGAVRQRDVRGCAAHVAADDPRFAGPGRNGQRAPARHRPGPTGRSPPAAPRRLAGGISPPWEAITARGRGATARPKRER